MNSKDVKLNDKIWDQVYLKYQKNSTLGVRYPNKNLVGCFVFIATPEELSDIWSKYFSIQIKYFEFNTYSIFSKFYVVTGKKK